MLTPSVFVADLRALEAPGFEAVTILMTGPEPSFGGPMEWSVAARDADGWDYDPVVHFLDYWEALDYAIAVAEEAGLECLNEAMPS